MIKTIELESVDELQEYSFLMDNEIFDMAHQPNMDIIEAFDWIDYKADRLGQLTEANYQDIADKGVLSVEVMDVPRFIKNNECKEITNPTFFGPSGAPTPDGLLSNEIFGITKIDREGIYAYIDLVEDFIDPSCYKALLRTDRRFSGIVNATNRYIVTEKGDLVEDEKGGTGIKWLKANFSKMSLASKTSTSRKRELYVKYLKLNHSKGKMFINKYIVIPPLYRDVNTTGKYTGIGQINTFYVNLLVGARSLRENNNYRLSMADTTIARMQNTLKGIYDWACGNDNAMISDKGTGLSGKTGIIRRANLTKTSDYSSRCVLTAPELKVEAVDNLMVNLDQSAAPLAAVVADFYPFMMYNLRKFFENEFLNVSSYPVYKNGQMIRVPLKNPMYAFNDDVLKKRLKEFLYSYDNRFIPIEAPIDYDAIGWDPKKDKVYMTFRGTNKVSDYGQNPEPITKRALTWTDVIYIAAKRSVEGKIMSFTRYPIDSFYNTIYTKIEIASTKETEPLYINGEFYPFYPKITQDEMGKPTKSKFIDTMQVCNLYLKGMGADYDGDTGVMKGSFFEETNKELERFYNSKVNYVNLACTNIRTSSNESVQSIYNLTKVLMSDIKKLTQPEF